MSKETKSEKEQQNTRKKTGIIGSIKSFIDFFKDERFKFVVGLITLFFVAFLLLAFVSYIFTWKSDFSVLDKSFLDLLKNPEIAVDNWAGKSGAMLANYFIHDLFGIAAFPIL